MAQTYTGNVLCTLQAVDNVSEATLFNHLITNATNSNLANASLTSGMVLPPNTAESLYFGIFQGAYIKNIGATNNVGVSWDLNGIYADFGLLNPGAFLLFFQGTNAGTSAISNLQVNSPLGSTIEWAVWA